MKNLFQLCARMIGLSILLFSGAVLAGCAQPGTDLPQSTTTAGPALASDYPPAPALRSDYTPEADPGTQTLEIPEAGINLDLPGDWVVKQLPDNPIGMEFALAPAALIDFAESHVVVVDTAEATVERALEWLCGPEPQAPETVQLESGLEVQHMACWVNNPSTPQADWFYAEKNGKLVFVSVHDPSTRAVMMEWVNTITFME